MPVISQYNHGQFCWIDLVALDKSAAQEFYCQLFGWGTIDLDTQGGPPYSQFTLNDQVIAGCGEMSDDMKAEGMPPMWNSYVNVTEIEKTTDLAEELGGSISVPVTEILEFGKLAYLQDPTGAMIGLWEAGSHIGATQVNDVSCFCWNELATKDLKQAAEFYRQLFSWTYRDNPDSPAPYQIIECQGGDNGGVMQMTEEFGDMPSRWSVYFTVEDVESSCEAVTKLGGSVRFGPFETPVGPMAIVADPEQAGFSVIQVKTDD